MVFVVIAREMAGNKNAAVSRLLHAVQGCRNWEEGKGAPAPLTFCRARGGGGGSGRPLDFTQAFRKKWL